MTDIPKPTGLDWIKLREDMEKVRITESGWQRLTRKATENPLVPFGATVTVGALSYGLMAFIKGNSKTQQQMMRLRVGAQLFTILAAVSGVFFALPKEKRNLKDFIASGEKPKDISVYKLDK